MSPGRVRGSVFLRRSVPERPHVLSGSIIGTTAICSFSAPSLRERCGISLREGKEKSASFTELRFQPNRSAITFDQLFADREPRTGSLKLFLKVEPLKEAEDLLEVARIDPDAIVFD